MAARTLLQQAQLSTFGLRAAGWLVGLDEACVRLREVGDRARRADGGPVGTRAPAVAARGLPLSSGWPSRRCRGGRSACGRSSSRALGVLAGVFAKIARDVTLFAQNEVGELREGGGPARGGSSAMAHKRNPVASVAVLACTSGCPGSSRRCRRDGPGARARRRRLAGGVGDARDLLTLVGSAAAWSADLLAGLEVEVRMRENLDWPRRRGGVHG